MTGYKSKRAAAQDKLDSMEHEALKLALEALEGFIPYLPLKDEAQCNRYDLATTAIKAALAKPEQEPVAWYHDDFGTLELSRIQRVGWKPLYAAPPQRTWVGLTDEEVEQVCVPLGAAMLSFTEVARAIEAKLKEKNT